MNHGIEQFFIERSRSRRRISTISALLGGIMLVGLWALQLPLVRKTLRVPEMLRFGYQGPTRYVRLLQIEAEPGRADALTNVGRVTPLTGARRGGSGGSPVASRSPRPRQPGRSNTPGPGEDTRNLVARALSSQGRVPIFQSEELVIDHLVRPVYPDEVRERGVEGRVAVLARVDTAGSVVEAEVLTPSGEIQLDHAAEVAVRQCRFRPYRVDGLPQEVYAVFRFRFRLMEP